MANRLQELYEKKQYFKILGIKPTRDQDIINKAFRVTALQFHPDKGGSHDEMVILVDVMQKLNNMDYLKKLFQYAESGEDFDENHFQFETEFRTCTPEHAQDVMNGIIQSVMTTDLFTDLEESIESPFEVSFHYKHKGSYGEIKLVIKEELNDDDYREQQFQHVVTDGAFPNWVERTTVFLANSENLLKKVNHIIRDINKSTMQKSNNELFDKLNLWLNDQIIEIKAEIKQEYSANTRRGMSQIWLNQLTEYERIKAYSANNLRAIAGTALSFFGPVSLISSSAPSLVQPEYSSEHFEVNYFLLSLLTVASLTIVATLLYVLCQPEKKSTTEHLATLPKTI